MNLEVIQSALRERNIDAWLFYDHHHRDAISYRVLGLPDSLFVTRRWYYVIPANGEPQKLVHRIEAGHLDTRRAQSDAAKGRLGCFNSAERDWLFNREGVRPTRHHRTDERQDETAADAGTSRCCGRQGRG